MDPRTFTIRITRHPLTEAEWRSMFESGTLPADAGERTETATDFTKVTAISDTEAIAKARAATRLTVKGERLTFHEYTPGNTAGIYREMKEMDVENTGIWIKDNRIYVELPNGHAFKVDRHGLVSRWTPQLTDRSGLVPRSFSDLTAEVQYAIEREAGIPAAVAA